MPCQQDNAPKPERAAAPAAPNPVTIATEPLEYILSAHQELNALNVSTETATEPNVKLERDEADELLKMLDEAAADGNADIIYATGDDNDEMASGVFSYDDDEPEAEVVEPAQQISSDDAIPSPTDIGIPTNKDDNIYFEVTEYEELEEIDDESPELASSGELEEHTPNTNTHSPYSCDMWSGGDFVQQTTDLDHTKSCAFNGVDDKKQVSDDEAMNDDEAADFVDDDEHVSTVDEYVGDGLVSVVSFECNPCNKSFPNEHQFKQHCRKLHNKQDAARVELTCSWCSTTPFRTQLAYDQHIKQHVNTNVINNYLPFYPCHTCRKIFVQSNELDTHLAQVHNIIGVYIRAKPKTNPKI